MTLSHNLTETIKNLTGWTLQIYKVIKAVVEQISAIQASNIIKCVDNYSDNRKQVHVFAG